MPLTLHWNQLLHKKNESLKKNKLPNITAEDE